MTFFSLCGKYPNTSSFVCCESLRHEFCDERLVCRFWDGGAGFALGVSFALAASFAFGVSLSEAKIASLIRFGEPDRRTSRFPGETDRRGKRGGERSKGNPTPLVLGDEFCLAGDEWRRSGKV